MNLSVYIFIKKYIKNNNYFFKEHPIKFAVDKNSTTTTVEMLKILFFIKSANIYFYKKYKKAHIYSTF